MKRLAEHDTTLLDRDEAYKENIREIFN